MCPRSSDSEKSLTSPFASVIIDAWIAVWSITERPRLRATAPVTAAKFFIGTSSSAEVGLEHLEVRRKS